MCNHWESLVRTLVVATVIMVLGLVAVACVPTRTSQNTAEEVEVGKDVEVTPETEAEVVKVGQGSPVVTPGVPPAQVVLMVAATQEEAAVIQNQIDQFAEEHPDIEPELLIVPFDEFNDVLLTRIAAGTPPDVAVLSYNHIALLRDHLQPLAGLIYESNLNISDFLPDAVDSNTFYERLYGLPWLRSACLPRYRNLVLFEASQNHSEAFRLMAFLTQPVQQAQNYIELQWFPTRLSVYGRLEIECPLPQAIRPGPELVSQTVTLVEERWTVLEPVLEGQTINSYEAVIETIASDARITAAPVMTAPGTEAEFVEAVRSKDVVIGALFLEGDLGYPPAGDYAVKCRLAPKGQILCYLVKPDGKEIELESKLSCTEAPVGQPFCLVIRDSSLCFCLDRRRYCFW